MNALPDWVGVSVSNSASSAFSRLAADFADRIPSDFLGGHHNNIANAITDIRDSFTDWHVKMRPRLYIDGNQWCALYGENLMEGVAGFGDSPAAACYAFDREFCMKLSATTKGTAQ